VPELPEVETVVRTLGPELAGRRIADVVVREARLRGGVAPDLPDRLRGRLVTAIARRGKYLLATLDDHRVLLVHLGMTGRLTLSSGSPPWERHDHVVVRLEDASSGSRTAAFSSTTTPAGSAASR
jgi:formamidopyrimidine-DNA glycosylase